MADFLKMDIFFATTTLVVLLLGILSIIALYYVIRILRSIDHVAENVSEESDSIKADMGILREKLRDEGMKWKHFLDFFGRMASRGTKVRHKHNKED